MALEVDATKQELIQELEARGFVTEGEFSQNSPFMEAIAAAMVTVMTRDAEVIINAGSSAGTYKVS
ncbi:hypothetical protein VB549_10670 [Vibrio parahaemolyticus]|uniref:hypothetical protein n=1 Tax=Vibrio parahaemolyticus TaxID=670 RepID=UPI002B219B0F|nr:hypothetical protein [Vibrio parahaemolyticus]MEA5369919.1 hypothetical protein [Vibrio parahaemolyticus]